MLKKHLYLKFIAAFLLVVFVGVFLSTHPVQAATITVDGIVCTLAEAITAANNDADFGGCVGGGAYGVDTITLNADVTLTTTDNVTNGNNGLPSITGTIIIQSGLGNTIERGTAATTCPSGDPLVDDFRIFHVAASGSLTLNGVTVSNGCALGTACTNAACTTGMGAGGGIYNAGGAVVINNLSIIENNTAQGGASLCGGGCTSGAGNGGGIYSVGGSVDIDDSIVQNNDVLYGVCSVGGCTVANGFGGGGIYTNNSTVTIDASLVDNNYSDDDGAGMYAAGTGSVTVTGSSISNNDAYDDGAGLYNGGGGSVTITGGSTVSNNEAIENGGGIYNNSNGTVDIINSTVENNVSNMSGGGVLNNGSGNINITSNSLITGNLAADNGGGVLNDAAGTVTITDSEISGNSVNYNGGGIYNDSGTINVTASTISGNLADDGAGIYNDFNGTMTVTTTTLSGNIALGTGGGIFNGGDGVDVMDSTLSGNAASLGGGVYNDGTATTITNSTLSNNVAISGDSVYNTGSGIVDIGNSTLFEDGALGSDNLLDNNSGTINVFSSIVVTEFGTACLGNAITNLGYNIVSDGTCGIAPPDPSPAVVINLLDLGGLTNNGGLTETHLPGDLSIAIDAGSCPSLTADQRGVGFPRPIDIDDGLFPNADDGCDVGAVEVRDIIFDLALQKTTLQALPVTIGDDVIFTITVFNQGTLDAYNITLIDYIPPGFALSPTDANGWAGGATVTNTIAGPIIAGGSSSIDIVLRVQAGVLSGTHSNYAEITGAQDENGTDRSDADIDSVTDTIWNNDVVVDDVIDNSLGDEDDHDIATVTVGFFDLALSKTTSQIAPVMVGDDVVFTIRVVNQGSVIARNVDIIDYIPPGFALSPADSNGWVVGGTTVTNTIAGPIPVGGSVTIDIVLRVQPSVVNGVVTNGAEITGAEDDGFVDRTNDDVDSTPGNNIPAEDDHGQANVTVLVATYTYTPTPTDTLVPTNTPTPIDTATPTNTPTPIDTPTPTDTLIPTNTVTPSSTVTLTNTPTETITVTPTGTETLLPTLSLTPLTDETEIADATATAGATVIAGTTEVAQAAAVVQETQRAEYVATLEAGPRTRVYAEIGASITKGDRTTVVCTDVRGFVTCGDPSNVPDAEVTNTSSTSPANIDSPTIFKDGSPSMVAPGMLLTYTIFVDNPTASTWPGVSIEDVLPEAVTFVSTTHGTVDGQKITIELGSLAPFESIRIEIVTEVKEGDFPGITNTACLFIVVDGVKQEWECASTGFGAVLAINDDGEYYIVTGDVPVTYEIIRVVTFAVLLLAVIAILGFSFYRFKKLVKTD